MDKTTTKAHRPKLSDAAEKARGTNAKRQNKNATPPEKKKAVFAAAPLLGVCVDFVSNVMNIRIQNKSVEQEVTVRMNKNEANAVSFILGDFCRHNLQVDFLPA